MIHTWWMRERLQSFLDGELSEARRTALADHLDRCARCASALHHMAECDQLLVSYRPVPGALTPAASLALLERAMAEARTGRGGPGRGMTLLAWGFAALLVIAASRAAAWWIRPDQIAHTRQAPAPRMADQWSEMNPAGVPGAVIGSGAFEGDSLPEVHRRRPPKPSTMRRDPRQARKSGQATPVIPPHLDPRPRRAPPLRHRFIAQAVPAVGLGLPDHGRAEDAGGSDEERVTRGIPTGSSDAGPFDAAGGPIEVNLDDRVCERQAVRLVSAALDGDAGAVQRVVEALADNPSDAISANDPVIGDPASGDEPAARIAEMPLPWEGDDPQNRWRNALLPSPQLLVMVSTEAAPSPVTVTEAPEDKPGYSRAIACRPDASGQATWMQATASTEARRTQTALVLLGDEVWDW